MRLPVKGLGRLIKQLLVPGLLLAMIGCGEEPGRVRVNQAEVIGEYEAGFQQGREKLELREDHTYIQELVSEKQSIHQTGSWRIENHLFGGSNIILVGAVVSEDDSTSSARRIGDRTLNAHKRSGKLALAINEAADWYFVRIN